MNTLVQVNDRLGELIRSTRRRRGWTLEGLHARLLAAGGPAPSVPTLSRIERGFATFTIQEASCACRVLGISFHALQISLRIQRTGACTAVPAEVLLQRASELYAIGAHEELLANMEAAYDQSCIAHDGPQMDPEVRMRLAHYIAFLHQRFENWDVARHFARVALATPGIAAEDRICVHASLAAIDAMEGRWADFVPRRLALESFVKKLEGRPLAFVAMSVGAHERVRGAFESARKWLELALPVYAELRSLNALRGRVTLAECLIYTGERATGVGMIEQVRFEALERGYLHTAWFAADALGKARRTA